MPRPRVFRDTLRSSPAQDIALGRRMAAPSAAMCADGRLELRDDATHWVQHDAPATMNRLLLDHLDD